jgi:fibronectin type 3 domain-containing protein
VSYNIYRSLQSGGPYTRIGGALSTSFTDGNVQGGTTYFYVVTAVNSSGVESAASSPEQSVTVPK